MDDDTPPGASTKKLGLVTLTGSITLGSLIQAVATLGGLATAVYSAGASVQHLRDDLNRAAEIQQGQRQDECALLENMIRRMLPPAQRAGDPPQRHVSNVTD